MCSGFGPMVYDTVVQPIKIHKKLMIGKIQIKRFSAWERVRSENVLLAKYDDQQGWLPGSQLLLFKWS